MNSTRATHRRHPNAGLNAHTAPDASQVSLHETISPVNDQSKAELNEQPIHFEDLVERCMGNIDLANRLLDQSQTILAEDLKLLRQSWVNGDPIETPRLAHRLKGATANIGAYDLSDVFSRIELCGKANEEAAAQVDLLELESEWARFIEHIADLLDQA